MWKVILVVALFIILGSLFIYQNFFKGPVTDTDSGPQPVKIGDNAIYVSNQRPGSSIVINSAALSKKGFVVIYEDAKGRLGNIIGGTKLLPQGESKGAIAGITRMTVHGEALFAVLHEDSGDGIFSPSVDTPLRDEENNIVFIRFYIDREAPVTSNPSF